MDQEEIRLLVQRINEAWLLGYPEQIPGILGECFDEHMVIRGPGFQAMGPETGKAACIQSYLDFLQQCRVKACTLGTAAIDVFGDTAVATYPWNMTYEREGNDHKESGHDLFVFARRDGRWLAVWRAMLPDAAPAA